MPTRVLVFPSCNEPGLEVIDALRRHPRIEVFGAAGIPAETDPSVVVLGRGRRFELPFLMAENFESRLRALCVELEIDLVFPTMDAVVATLASLEEGPAYIGPSAEMATLCLSKSAVYRRVESQVSVPRAFGELDTLPAFAKPDTGSGSRGASVISSAEALESARTKGLLVQELLPGPEFTVDCLGTSAGDLVACSPRQRVTVAGGIARAATCVVRPDLRAHCEFIQRTLKLNGPWFAQFKEDRDGLPRLMEVNARVGGSSGLSRLAGVNIPLMAVLQATGVKLSEPRRLDGITLARKLDRTGQLDDFDWVVWDLDDTLLHTGDVVDPDAIATLFRLDQRGKSQLLLSRNVDPAAAVRRSKIPNLFVEILRTEDKVASMLKLQAKYGLELSRTLMINDSGAERIRFEREMPEVRTIGPDALGVLG
ncbi:MAG: hypothetical protein ACJAYU_001301 [Bradymonadia bacterium]|jgi:hypothetical protein